MQKPRKPIFQDEDTAQSEHQGLLEQLENILPIRVRKQSRARQAVVEAKNALIALEQALLLSQQDFQTFRAHQHQQVDALAQQKQGQRLNHESLDDWNNREKHMVEAVYQKHAELAQLQHNIQQLTQDIVRLERELKDLDKQVQKLEMMMEMLPQEAL